MLAPDVDCSPSMAPLPLENFTLSLDGLSSVSAEHIGRAGMLVIIPDMKFGCYGSISGWTGVFSVDTDSSQLLDQEELLVHFQVWRPVGNGSFNLVRSEPLVLNSTAFSEAQPLTSQERTLEMDDGDTYDQSLTGMTITWTVTSGGLTFEPDDVVGCFIPAADSLSAFLGLAFRDKSGQAGQDGGGEADLLVYPVEEDICDAAVVCEESRVIISSVRPLLYPHQEREFDLSFQLILILQNSIKPIKLGLVGPTTLIARASQLIPGIIVVYEDTRNIIMQDGEIALASNNDNVDSLFD